MIADVYIIKYLPNNLLSDIWCRNVRSLIPIEANTKVSKKVDILELLFK